MGNLEREALELAHIWPKTYPSLEEGKEKTTSYWFIGLVIKVNTLNFRYLQLYMQLTLQIL